MTDIFVANDYAMARSPYTHAMTIDQSNHLYPLNRAIEVSVALYLVSMCHSFLTYNFFFHHDADGTMLKLTPQKPLSYCP